MTRYEMWSLVIQFFAAVGTVFIAVLAIWGDLIRHRLVPPKLSVTLRTPQNELAHFNDGPWWYYHLVVTNQRKWAPVRLVRVFVTSLKRQTGNDSNWVPAMQGGPVPLEWQYQRNSPLADDWLTIGPDKIWDLGRVKPGGPFTLSVVHFASNFQGTLVGPGKLRVGLMAIGETAQSPEFVIEISWDGRWAESAGEMGRHLVVKEVSNTAV